MQNLKAFFFEGYASPFNALRQDMHVWSAAALGIEGIPRFLWSADSLVVYLDGYPMPIAALVAGVQESEREATKLFYQLVLRGRKHAALEKKLTKLLDPTNTKEHLHDSARKLEPNYCFLTDPANQALFKDCDDWLTDQLASEFTQQSDNGEVLYSSFAVRAWMRDCTRFLTVRSPFLPGFPSLASRAEQHPFFF